MIPYDFPTWLAGIGGGVTTLSFALVQMTCNCNYLLSYQAKKQSRDMRSHFIRFVSLCIMMSYLPENKAHMPLAFTGRTCSRGRWNVPLSVSSNSPSSAYHLHTHWLNIDATIRIGRCHQRGGGPEANHDASRALSPESGPHPGSHNAFSRMLSLQFASTS